MVGEMDQPEISRSTGAPLVELYPNNGLWKHWLGAASPSAFLPDFFNGASALETALGETQSGSCPSLPEGFASKLIADLDHSTTEIKDRELVARSIRDLVAGKARAVVTGQQPGFGGGPLYTLLKISTIVALARLRTRAGLPTVPVFWMGDDDDDWAEAGHPLLWDGAEWETVSSALLNHPRQGRLDMIGTLPFSRLEKPTGELLRALEPKTGHGTEISALYREARKYDWSLSELTEKILRIVFRGTGLVIVRGNDDSLHQHCLGFYQMVMPQLDKLADLTKIQSSLLANEFGIDPVGANSLKRPLYRVEGTRRVPHDDQATPDDSAGLRCGVLLRSLLQDWLLKPAAVVVGPGELSYLAQLVPAYEHLGIGRCPLIPRLFGWVLPEDFSADFVQQFNASAGINLETAREMAEFAGRASEKELVRLLVEKIGIEEKRAGELAGSRTRRWVKGVQSLLRNESLKQTEINRPANPAWVFPAGQRQERRLAWLPCVATWGPAFVQNVLDSAELHLQTGRTGSWNEYLLRVQVPRWWKPKGKDS
jgi:uncharacterized protein YllA (UPF0747 family)